MSDPYKVEYCAVWPGPSRAILIEPTEDREAFFNKFDAIISQLEAINCPRNLRPTVEVRSLEWTPWISYGRAQERGWLK